MIQIISIEFKKGLSGTLTIRFLVRLIQRLVVRNLLLLFHCPCLLDSVPDGERYSKLQVHFLLEEMSSVSHLFGFNYFRFESNRTN